MLGIAIVVHFFVDFATSIFQPLGPYITDKFSISPRMYAMALYFISLVSSITQPVFGTLTDKVSKRNIYLTVVASVTFLFASLISIAGSFLIFLVFAFVAQLSNSAFHPMGASIAGQEKKQHLAFFSIAGMFGYAVGPVFISWYAEVHQLKGLYYFGILLAIFAVLTLPRVKSLEREKRKVRRSWFGFRVVMPIFFFVAFRSFSMGIAQLYGPLYAKMLGKSLVFGGSLLTFTRFIGMFLSTLGVYIGTRIGNSIINIISAGAMVVFGIVFASTDFSNIPSVLMAVLFVLMLSPAYLSMSSTVVEAQSRLPRNPGFASSIVMGFAWSIGSLMNFIYSSIFGNDVEFMIKSFWAISLLALGAGIWDAVNVGFRQSQ